MVKIYSVVYQLYITCYWVWLLLQVWHWFQRNSSTASCRDFLYVLFALSLSLPHCVQRMRLGSNKSTFQNKSIQTKYICCKSVLTNTECDTKIISTKWQKHWRLLRRNNSSSFTFKAHHTLFFIDTENCVYCIYLLQHDMANNRLWSQSLQLLSSNI